MSEDNLLHFITSYGTRKGCRLEDILKQYGTYYSHQMSEDLKRLEDQGKIKFAGAEVLFIVLPE